MLNKAATLLVTVSILVLSGCCKEETLAKVDSPDKTVSAALTIRDCGATTAEHAGITLKSNTNWFGSEEAIFVTKYNSHIEMRWRSNSELMVFCAGCKPEDVRLQKTKFHTVTVDYKFGVAGLDY